MSRQLVRDCDGVTYRVLERGRVVASGSLAEVRPFLPAPPTFRIGRGPYGDWELVTIEADGSRYFENFPTRAAARAERATRLDDLRRAAA